MKCRAIIENWAGHPADCDAGLLSDEAAAKSKGSGSVAFRSCFSGLGVAKCYLHDAYESE